MVRRIAAAVVLSITFVWLAGLAGAPSAGASIAYTATAGADAIRSTVTAADSPGTDTPFDGGGPSAQATVTSTGTSRAFASLPYPGELAVTLPGLLAALGAGGIPAYPAYQASDHPITPEAKLEAPGYGLHARSDAASSSAEAVAGDAESGLGTGRSTAHVGRGEAGAVIASAESVVRDLRIGEVVIGESRAAATASVAPDGRTARQGSFRLTAVAIAGQGVTIGPEGITLNDRTAAPAGTQPLVKLLADHGLKLEYLAPVETGHGIVSAGLRITVVRPPASGGTGTWVLTLGRASAAVDAVAQPEPVLEAAPPVLADPASSPGVPATALDVSSNPAGTGPAAAGARPVRLPAGVSTGTMADTPLGVAAGERGVAPADRNPAVAPIDNRPAGEVAVPVLARGSLFDASRAFPAIVLIAGLIYAALGAVGRMNLEG
jgi:hypothetical protein